MKADKYLKRFSEREAGAKMSGSGKKAEKTENKEEKETEKD